MFSGYTLVSLTFIRLPTVVYLGAPFTLTFR